MRRQLNEALRAGRRTGALPVLIGMLLPVPFLLVFHQLYFWEVPLFSSRRWAVGTDRSFIEIFGYVQLAVAAALLLAVGLRRRAGPVYLGWAATLTTIALDDSLMWHERGGAWLVRHGAVPDVLGLPEQALGELVAWGLMGLPVLALLVLTHRLSSAPARRDSWWLAGLILLLMFFGVGVDLLHDALEQRVDSDLMDLTMILAEAGGELLGMAALLAYVVHLTRRRSSTGLPRARVDRSETIKSA